MLTIIGMEVRKDLFSEMQYKKDQNSCLHLKKPGREGERDRRFLTYFPSLKPSVWNIFYLAHLKTTLIKPWMVIHWDSLRVICHIHAKEEGVQVAWFWKRLGNSAYTIHSTLWCMDMRYSVGSIRDLARWRMMLGSVLENTASAERSLCTWKMLIINGRGVLSRCNEILSCCGTVQNRQSHPSVASTIL